MEVKLTDRMPGDWAPKAPETEKKCQTCSPAEEKKKKEQKACLSDLKGYGRIGSTLGRAGGVVGSGFGAAIGGMLALGGDNCQYGFLGAGPAGSTYTPAQMGPGGSIIPGRLD
jgi:hypothetical protein